MALLSVYTATSDVITGQVTVGTSWSLTFFRPSGSLRIASIHRIWISQNTRNTVAGSSTRFSVHFISAENAVPGGTLLSSQAQDVLLPNSDMIVRSGPAAPTVTGNPLFDFLESPNLPQNFLWDIFKETGSPLLLRSEEDLGIGVRHVVSGVDGSANSYTIGIVWSEL